MRPRPRAVVVLSGGLDSVLTRALAVRENFETYALTFGYNLRHVGEVKAARRVAANLQAAERAAVTTGLRRFGGCFNEVGVRDPATYRPSAVVPA